MSEDEWLTYISITENSEGAVGSKDTILGVTVAFSIMKENFIQIRLTVYQ